MPGSCPFGKDTLAFAALLEYPDKKRRGAKGVFCMDEPSANIKLVGKRLFRLLPVQLLLCALGAGNDFAPLLRGAPVCDRLFRCSRRAACPAAALLPDHA